MYPLITFIVLYSLKVYFNIISSVCTVYNQSESARNNIRQPHSILFRKNPLKMQFQGIYSFKTNDRSESLILRSAPVNTEAFSQNNG